MMTTTYENTRLTMNTSVSKNDRGDKRIREYSRPVRAGGTRQCSGSGLPLKIGIVVSDKNSSHLSFHTYPTIQLSPSNDGYYLSEVRPSLQFFTNARAFFPYLFFQR